MERLTVKRNGVWHFEDWERGIDCTGKAIDRLAAYEDTGLEPEDMKRAFNDDAVLKIAGQVLGTTTDRLRAISEADKDGRLVVLPCKVGLRVKVDARTWGNVWNYKTIENGRFLVGEVVSITMTRKQILMKIRVEHNVGWKRPMKRYPVSALGVTAFPLEAEAALRGEEHAKP